MRWKDLLGLVKWTGEVQIVSMGIVGGYTNLNAKLTSQCIDGDKYEVYVSGNFGGIDIGILPADGSSSNVVLEDNNIKIDPNVFEGDANIGGVSVLPGAGPSWSYIKLGGAETADGSNGGVSIGIGAGFIAMQGSSHVKYKKKLSCGCGGGW
jgi:hypothetical protein